MRNQVLATHPTQGIFQLHQLDEDVVFGVNLRGMHGPLEVERQPFLNAAHAGALRQIHEQDEVQHQGRGQDGIAAEEIYFDLHGVAEPAEDVDVVPAFLGIAARRVVLDTDLVVELLVQVGIESALQDVLQGGTLGDFLGTEGPGFVEHFAVAIAQDIGGEPAAEAQHARLQAGGDQGLHEGLAALEVLAANRQIHVARQFLEGGHVGGEMGRTVGVRDAGFERGVGVNLAGGDFRIVLLEARLEVLQGSVDGGSLVIDLGGAAPDHGGACHAGALLELADVVHDHLGVLHLGTRGLDVGALDALDEVLVEDRLHGQDRRERRLYLLEQGGFQDAGLGGGFVGVILENVPAGHFDVGHFGQWNEVLNSGAAPLCPLPQADGSQLRQGADRLPQSKLEGFQPGDERRGHRAHARDQNTQFALSGRNLDAVFIGQIFSFRPKCYNTKSMRDRATATLTTVVVDDEQLACEELAYLDRKFPEIEVIARGSNGLRAVELIRKLEPELVFLDIKDRKSTRL